MNDNEHSGRGERPPPHGANEGQRAHWKDRDNACEPRRLACADGADDVADDVAWRSTPEETAAYITDLLQGLAVLAQRADLPSLSYLLGVAAREAKEQSGRRD